ncbi:MAG: UDP-N-acetylglucosamine 1-carboxyvinyltransferase [Phycisphaerae bacterium]|jgi:UDP-N-acetylglucosamine 1-carboxyvinyltransferase|nr:UDP-N-acetylglucosamine 1-carboxyvinyltransferase [Phycisphaerae bacterium]
MDYFVIQGGKRLRGTIKISGSKNAALPIMAATLMCSEPVVLRNIPDLSDIEYMVTILEKLGVRVDRLEPGTMRFEVVDESISHADYETVRKMRASVCVMGPLLGKRLHARVAMPGGCSIGTRPIDLHLKGFEALGADVDLIEGGDVDCQAEKLEGSEIFLGGHFGSSVTATANVMMAAVFAEGTTVLESAACEPEVEDLANFLVAMGANITGQGSPRIVIEGVDRLDGGEYTIIPDRIEAGTFMVAAAITNSELRLENCRTAHLMAATKVLEDVGVFVEKDNGDVIISSSRLLQPVEITTQPYPGFPTDLQAQFMTLLSLAEGNSVITEKIFPDRFLHVAELNRMGAKLRKEGPIVIVEGVKRLIGAPVMASDLRASAALVLAGLVARGTTEINRVYHIDRGYERIEEKLNAVGAEIHRLDR